MSMSTILIYVKYEIVSLYKRCSRNCVKNTEMAVIAAERRLRNLKYNPSGDLKKCVDIFDQRIQELCNAGGELNDQNTIHNLHCSLPAFYDPVTVI